MPPPTRGSLRSGAIPGPGGRAVSRAPAARACSLPSCTPLSAWGPSIVSRAGPARARPSSWLPVPAASAEGERAGEGALSRGGAVLAPQRLFPPQVVLHVGEVAVGPEQHHISGRRHHTGQPRFHRQAGLLP